MCKNTFLCVDDYGHCGSGKTLTEAFEEYKASGDQEVEDLIFYEASELSVKHEIVPVLVTNIKKG